MPSIEEIFLYSNMASGINEHLRCYLDDASVLDVLCLRCKLRVVRECKSHNYQIHVKTRKIISLGCGCWAHCYVHLHNEIKKTLKDTKLSWYHPIPQMLTHIYEQRIKHTNIHAKTKQTILLILSKLLSMFVFL